MTDNLTAIQKYVTAGFDHVWIHQSGPDQDGFFDFVQSDLLPALRQKGLVADRPWEPAKVDNPKKQTRAAVLVR